MQDKTNMRPELLYNYERNRKDRIKKMYYIEMPLSIIKKDNK